MGTHDGLGAAVAAQFVKVVEGRLRAGQDDDVGLLDVIHVVGVEKVNPRILLQRVEIGVVGEVLEHHHGDVHLATLRLHRFLREGHAVFLLDVDILVVGHNAQYWHATEVLHHSPTLVEEAHVATEFVDDDALDERAVLGCL